MSSLRTVTIRRGVYYPDDLNVYCPAFPRRKGLLTVNRGGATYELFDIKIAKAYEFVFPDSDKDSWVTTCAQQYIGPDLVMVSDHCYTTYINLV